MKNFAIILILLLFYPSYLLAAESCPLYSSFLSKLDHDNSTQYLLCEDYSPHQYRLINIKTQSDEFFLINESGGFTALIPRLKNLNWDQTELKKVEKRYEENKIKAQKFFIDRQALAAVSLLNYANSAIARDLSRVEPCEYNLSYYRDLSKFKAKNYIMSCSVKIPNEIKAKLGIKKAGNVSLLDVKNLLGDASIRLQSVTASNSEAIVTPTAYNHYKVFIKRKKDNKEILLNGTCQEKIKRKISSQIKKAFEESRNTAFVNPLDQPIKILDVDVNFPMNILISPTDKSKLSSDTPSTSDNKDVDLDLGAKFNVSVLGDYNLSISPNIILPISKNVNGVNDTLRNFRITDTLSPKEIGVVFEIKF